MDVGETQQLVGHASTVGYYLQYTIAPIILAALPVVRVKLNRFLDDISAIRKLLEEQVNEKETAIAAATSAIPKS
jgi:hypothetical protein